MKINVSMRCNTREINNVEMFKVNLGKKKKNHLILLIFHLEIEIAHLNYQCGVYKVLGIAFGEAVC